MTISPPAVLLGAQQPRFRTVPPARSSAGQEAVELAASAGLLLDPWQQMVLEGSLGERSDGRWAALEVGVTCTRQNGKGAILEARELAGLFLFGEGLITHTAHRLDTCLEHFLRMKALIERTPDLQRKVRRIREANGDEGIELISGQRLNFKARSKGSGRGFTGDLVVLDEAYWLQDLASLIPTLSAKSVQGNPQVWYTSSAPLPRAESDVLRRFCQRGRTGSGRLAYFEWSVEPDSDLDDREVWALANPSLGTRISEEWIGMERASMTDEEFARERLGIFHTADKAGAGWHVITEENWAACLNPAATPSPGPLAWALDCSPDGKSAAIATSDGTYVEVVDHREGTSWAPGRLLELHQRHGFTLRLDKSGPAGALLTTLDEIGVPWDPVTLQEHAQACGQFLTATTDRTLVHRGQPPLDAAVKDAERRKVTDVWLWTRSKSTGDISPLVAAGIARWAAGALRDDGDFLVL